MNDEEIMRKMGLPPYWKAEWLRPGVPIELPPEASETTNVYPVGQLGEKWPGAWEGKPRPESKSRPWWKFW